MKNFAQAKGQGEWAEVCFLWRASALGFTVSRPFGDNARYDFVVDAGAGLLRVQVKSVSVAHRADYRIPASSGGRKKKAYTPGQIDFLAAYIIPEDAWYIIPYKVLAPYNKRRAFSLHTTESKVRNSLDKYRERWDLFE